MVVTLEEPAVATEAEARALIPLEELFGNPERLNPQLAPDGTRVAYAAPDERGVLQVWVRAHDRREVARVVTGDQKRGVRVFQWAYDGIHLLYLQDRDGDENWHVYSVDVSHVTARGVPEARDLTPFEGVQAQLVALELAVPGQALVALNRNDRRRHDVYRIDLRSGAMTLDTENPGGVIQWVTDAALHVRAAVATTPDGGKDVLVRTAEDRPWVSRLRWSQEDDGRVVGFSVDGYTLYVVGSHGANAQRLVALEVAAGDGRVSEQQSDERVIGEDAEYDVAEVLFHPVARRPEAVAFHRERLIWQALEPQTAARLETLERCIPGQLAIAGRDLADARWLVSSSSPNGPIRYFLYDTHTQAVEFLFSHRPMLEEVSLALSAPVSFNARDGLTLHGYLTLPKNEPAHDLPAVLLVHGGPWERDGWRFDPAVQLLADRGCAVLQVNFRGSAGYGKAFLHAGDREWGAKMETDLVDGAHWLADQGIADPRRIGIMGASYGGYAALAGLVFHPGVFAAGISVVGPSNLSSLLASIPPYWAPVRAMFARRIGDPETEGAFLRSRSPLFFVDQIEAPLLVCQGANDPRVPRAESEQIVAALRAAGKPVEYCLYEDEGHGLARPANRLDFFRRVEAFLTEHLQLGV